MRFFMAALRSGLAPQKAEEGTWPHVVPLWSCKEAFSKITPEAPQLGTTALKPVEPMTQDPKCPGSSRQKPARTEISQNQLAPTTPIPSHSWNNGQEEGEGGLGDRPPSDVD